ncbi:hydroxylase [Mycobacterium intermedium]|uniref:Hydroxylase n=2 Tax=Mycobacterium TaxID=1763 RepID=A0A1E3S5P4_MYCIE|nr:MULTISPECIES: acyl-CoA dehydrogenase family protein [Mycobacterium]MCV6965356.1 hydroxylase [Mycobacterium intermedium]MCV6975736.1 hydroxylase [Mycobacterium bourgelatii]ODQ96972.1 hydroxylase [Mycobacterium intermedium]OPE46590.1 hydroxylase [Mycobacterium intermedium]ORA94816.1 hydroxylase [Mycobacterium intermedium]
MNHSDTDIESVAAKIALSAGEMSAETDRERRLPDGLVDLLREAGLFRATMPIEVDALELAPGPALRCAEAVARGDAAAGWCVSIAITSALLVAYLPESSRVEMFGGGKGVAAGVWAPRGTARSVDGGVVVSGRWPFCSGINHADMMFAGCFIDEGRVPSVVALRKDDLQVLDTWHTLGLRGTGSHDSVAEDVFVPADRVFSLFDGPVIDRPLYRFPVFGFFALSIGAAALGNARAAIDDLVELAVGKKGLGATRTLAERTPTQAAVATADSGLRAARALYYEAIDDAWQASQEPGPVPLALRNRLRLAATHAVRTSADVVRSMYDLAGGTAIYDGAPLQRRFRDAFTATAHFQVNEASRELPGRVLLDLPAEVSML